MSIIERVVLRYYETVDGANPVKVVDLFAGDAVYRRPGYRPMVGRQALLDFYGGERVIAAGRHTITSVVEDGSRHAAVEGRFAGTLRDGSAVDLGFADFFTLDGELIVERTTYFEASAV